LLGCYGNYPQYSLRAIDSIVSGHDLHRYANVLVGLNECGQQTVQRVRELKDKRLIDGVVDCTWNMNKDPMLRVLLELVRTPYVMWLDDDSHFVNRDWPSRFAQMTVGQHPFDVAGPLRFWGPNREAYPDYLKVASSRPWWQGDAHYPWHRRKSVPFALGGCFIARTEFLRTHNFPDRGMIKHLDDVLLGELILQVGGKLVGFSDELSEAVKVNDGERRGEAEPSSKNAS
jgi:hypothetical protein